jgi:hypothetical protein
MADKPPPDPRPIVPWPLCHCHRVGFSGLISECLRVAHGEDEPHEFRLTGERVNPVILRQGL